MHGALLRPLAGGAFYNKRGIISPVMALTKTQRAPEGDPKRSEHIGHTAVFTHSAATRALQGSSLGLLSTR